jgi:hypothetical protein
MEPPPKPHNYQPSYSPCIINVYNHFQLYPPRYCWSNAELPELRESEIDDFFRRVEEMSKPLRGTPPQDQNNNNISILGNKTYS